MPAQKFGSAHTELKLEKLAAYLKAFTTALRKQPFERIYIDAFAGTGEIETAGAELPLIDGAEVGPFISGSVRRSLEVDPPFSRYIFIESDAAKAESLRTMTTSYRNRSCEILVGDANDKLREVVARTNWAKTRAVVFLDPFGSQVSWETLAALGATRSIDLWYLFPSGLSVLRQISKSGRVLPEHKPSLDRMFGPNDWEGVLIKKVPMQDLFGNVDEQLVHRASATEITERMIEWMGAIFAGGVNAKWLPLGSRNVHMYSLVFACSNPTERASKLAHTLAGAVLSATKKRK